MMDKKELYKKVEDLDLFCLGIRKYVVLSEVLYLIKQLDEPQKVTIPQFVADWIEYCKEHNFTLLGCLDPVDELGMSWSEGFEGDAIKCVKWCRKESNTFAKAWSNGYEVEKEKQYIVKVNNTMEASKYLKYDKVVKNGILEWLVVLMQYVYTIQKKSLLVEALSGYYLVKV